MNDKNVAIILDENWLYEQVKKKKKIFFFYWYYCIWNVGLFDRERKLNDETYIEKITKE